MKAGDFNYNLTNHSRIDWLIERKKFFSFISCYHIDFPVNYRLIDAVVEILMLLSTVEVSE